MTGAQILATARKTTETQMRKRYLDRGPLMSISHSVLAGMTSRGCAVTDDEVVSDAVTVALLEGRVLGRYVVTDDRRAWVTAEYGWDLLRASSEDLVDLAAKWRSAPGRTHLSLRYDAIRGHLRDVALHAVTANPDDAPLVLAVTLWVLTNADKSELSDAVELLQDAPARPLATALAGLLERDSDDLEVEDLAGTIAAILAPAA